jgi:hypothetical protein
MHLFVQLKKRRIANNSAIEKTTLKLTLPLGVCIYFSNEGKIQLSTEQAVDSH